MTKAKSPETFDFVATGEGFTLEGRIALTPAEPAPPTMTLAPSSLPAGQVGQPYQAQLVATGGTPPYTYTLDDLPQGLLITTATGAISGTPTTEGATPTLGTVTGPTGTHAFPFLCCYDPADLERVRHHEVADYAPEPAWFANLTTQFGIRSAPETTHGAARNIHGGYFDPDTGRFYALTHRADNSNWGTNGALFHVWQVAP